MTVSMLAACGVFPAPARAQADDPDALYADRGNLASARRAADLWDAALRRDPADVDAAWKLARACYWLGRHVPDDEVRAQFERGIAAARLVEAHAPNRPEGPFWRAANMAGLAETQGLRAGLKYRTPIREALEKVLAMDPAFQQGSADRALGRWYYKVPGLFGGDMRKSEAHLRNALTYNPDSIISLLFLAETLVELDRRADARAALQKALDTPPDPEWLPEDARFKVQARDLLARLSRR
jgi:tetratricopeptide (TPR) repeat protein